VTPAIGAALAIRLAAPAAGGCGTVLEVREEIDFMPDGDRTVDISADDDCTMRGFTLDRYVAEEITAPELHVVGIHTALRPTGFPFGEAMIRIERPGPSILVLSAYEWTRWRVDASPGAVVDRVIATGYETQEVVAGDGTEVEVVDFATTGDMLGLGIAWPSESERGGDCRDFFSPAECQLYGGIWQHELQRRLEELRSLVDRAEERTGTALASFHGCYGMSELTLGEARPTP
jgi:hypothetical protein